MALQPCTVPAEPAAEAVVTDYTAQLSTLEFTAHNIELPGGARTWPEGGELLEDSSRCLTALSLLNDRCPPGERYRFKVADLGCLEGGYTAAFARAGYLTTGIEARPLNMAKCELVAEALGLGNMRFVQDDARNLSRYEPFDAVFCCGLLYHLDKPAEFLRMLGRQARQLLIVQSHWSGTCHQSNEGYRGHWFAENPAPESVWSSWGNDRSFWLGREELMRAMRAAGFEDVRQVDDGTFVPERGMFAGVKPP
jgi:SAM-dependent methyltransferase